MYPYSNAEVSTFRRELATQLERERGCQNGATNATQNTQQTTRNEASEGREQWCCGHALACKQSSKRCRKRARPSPSREQSPPSQGHYHLGRCHSLPPAQRPHDRRTALLLPVKPPWLPSNGPQGQGRTNRPVDPMRCRQNLQASVITRERRVLSKQQSLLNIQWNAQEKRHAHCKKI